MSTTIKWGLITGMIYVIHTLITNLLGLQEGGQMMLGFLLNIVLFAATYFTIYLSVKETRDTALGGYLTAGQAVRTGLGVALIAGLVSAVFTILNMNVIDPGMADKILAAAEAEMDARNIPEEQREMSRQMSRYFVNPFFLIPMTTAWVVFWGLIKGVIAGQMLKREAPPNTPFA